ncbi:MAG: hypothetical protein IPP49_20750 [Saprospiraceae bacterium]|nr:hypothetical protein [Saprospiraceae bacterium]
MRKPKYTFGAEIHQESASWNSSAGKSTMYTIRQYKNCTESSAIAE